MEEKKFRKLHLREAVAAATLALSTPNSDVNAQEALRFVSPHTAQELFKRNEQGPLRIDIDRNLLSAQEIIAEREEATESLLKRLPDDPRFNYLRDRERIEAESQAYEPDKTERQRVVEASKQEMLELAKEIPVREYGFFAFADIDENDNERHRLYILQKAPTNAVQFVKAFRISMSANGFGNKKDSKQTPLGLHFIKSGYEGMFGEVVTAEKDLLSYFKHTYTDESGKRHWFVSHIGDTFPFLEPATVTTNRFTIDEQRGIHFHGTNRSGRWQEHEDGSKEWRTLLGGPRSGACFRTDNNSSENMRLRYARMPVVEKGVVTKQGTPVFIHATPEVLQRTRNADSVDEIGGAPERSEIPPPRRASRDRKRSRSNEGGFNPFKQLE